MKPERSFRKLWLIRILFAIGSPVIFLVLVESGLRIFHFGYPTGFFIHDKQSDGMLTENSAFGWRFFPRPIARVPDPIRMLQKKPPQTFRIFVFGESAALGDPVPAYGLSRFLSVLLSDRYPGTNFEVVNTAMTAINSNVILPIAKDCSGLGGDCWIFYMGNNEVVGPFGAGSVFGPRVPPLPIIRANLAFKSTRMGQCFDQILGSFVKSGPSEWGGMEMMLKSEVGLEDRRLQQMYSNFSKNLNDCIAAGTRSGAKVVVSSMLSNLKDCPPFASRHLAGLPASQLEKWNELYKSGEAQLAAKAFSSALTQFNDAKKLDDSYAELEYCIGLSQLALGNNETALRSFEKARDLDALRFRCDSELNHRIQRAAAVRESSGVRFLDLWSALGASQTNIPGTNIFLEHVHFNFHGNYSLARAMVDEVGQALQLTSSKPYLTEDQCAARLAFTDWDRALLQNDILERFRRAPFTNQLNASFRTELWRSDTESLRRASKNNFPKTISIYRQALATRENDYILHDRFGVVLEAAGDFAGAGAQWRRAVELIPQYVDATFKVGTVSARLHQYSEAESWFKKALALRPSSVEARNELGLALAAEGKTNEAVVEFQEALRTRPSFAEAHVNWGLMLFNAGALAEAEQHYRAAITVNPQSTAAHINLGKLLVSQKKIDSAIEQYREALKIRPDDPLIHFNLAGAYKAAKRNDEALSEYQEAVRLDPVFAVAQFNLGVLLANAGNRTEARTHFAAAVAADPTSAEAEFYLAMTYLQDGRLAEGAAHLEKVLAIDPAHAKAHTYLDRLRSGKSGKEQGIMERPIP